MTPVILGENGLRLLMVVSDHSTVDWSTDGICLDYYNPSDRMGHTHARPPMHKVSPQVRQGLSDQLRHQPVRAVSLGDAAGRSTAAASPLLQYPEQLRKIQRSAQRLSVNKPRDALLYIRGIASERGTPGGEPFVRHCDSSQVLLMNPAQSSIFSCSGVFNFDVTYPKITILKLDESAFKYQLNFVSYSYQLHSWVVVSRVLFVSVR